MGIRVSHRVGSVSVSAPALLLLAAIVAVPLVVLVGIIATVARSGWIVAVALPVGIAATVWFVVWGVRREQRRQ
jgi:hypothetical protein